MSEPFTKFLLHYPITIVLLSLGEDEYKVGEFIMENVNADSVVLDSMELERLNNI